MCCGNLPGFHAFIVSRNISKVNGFYQGYGEWEPRRGDRGAKKPCIHKNKVAHNYSYAPLLQLQRGKTPKDLTVGC